MSTNTAWLALWLDAPLQAWGFESRFERRHTGMFPTKSGILGMICAAAGAPKGSEQERRILQGFSTKGMIAVRLPRRIAFAGSTKCKELPVRRLTDYHTIANTRTAESAKPRSEQTVQSWRDYLQDVRFIVLLPGERPIVETAATALREPVWGVWLGRKACIASAPVLVTSQDVSVFDSQASAWQASLALAAALDKQAAFPVDAPLEAFTRLQDAISFEDGTDSWCDAPVQFGRPGHSGNEGRQFSPRRVKIIHRQSKG